MEFGPQNMTVLDGKDVTINCQAAGAPTPNITWIYNGMFDKNYANDTFSYHRNNCVSICRADSLLTRWC